MPAGPINTVAEVFSDPQVSRAACASICPRPALRAEPFPRCGPRS